MSDPIELEDGRALRGKFPGGPGRGPRRERPGRVCRSEDCQTLLSIYNAGDRCWEHTNPSPYLLNVRRFRTTKLSA